MSLEALFNREAERTVVAAILLEPSLVHELEGTLSATDFHDRPHALVYRAVQCLLERGDQPDQVTLADFLDRHRQLDAVGGKAFLDSLVGSGSDVASALQHARIVREKALLRGLALAARRVLDGVYESEEDAATVIEQAERALFKLTQASHAGGYVASPELVTSTMREIDALLANRGTLPGIPTGFPELDAMTGGLRRGNLYIVAARPSMGKSSLMLNWAAHATLREQKRTVIHSLEMSDTSIMQRLLASEASVDMQALTNGHITDAATARLRTAGDRLRQAQLLVDHNSSLTLGALRAQARREAAKGGLDLILIDYLQLMSSGQKEESRTGEISRISRDLKILARDLDVPVVVLSQLNRGVEARANKRPMLSDLRDSGSLEQDADLVMFLYREDYYNPQSDEKGVGELIVAKQRNGPIGTVKAQWVDALASYKPLEVAAA